MRLNLIIASLVGMIAVLGYSLWSIQQDFDRLIEINKAILLDASKSFQERNEALKRLHECQGDRP